MIIIAHTNGHGYFLPRVYRRLAGKNKREWRNTISLSDVRLHHSVESKKRGEVHSVLHTNAAKLNAPPVRVFSKRSRQPPSVALVARAVWLSTRMTED